MEEYYLGKNSWSSNSADWKQRFEVGDAINDPAGDWDPSTAETYIDQQVGIEASTRLAQDTYLGNEINTIKKNKIYLTGTTLSQDQINLPNTIYVVKDNLTLTENITVPNGCVLEFDGGSLNNGSIAFNNTTLYGNIKLNTICDGAIANEEGYVSWFLNDAITSSNIEWLMASTYKTDIDKTIIISNPINLGNHKCEIYSSNNSIIKINCYPTDYSGQAAYWILSTGSNSVTIHDIVVDFEEKQYPKPVPTGAKAGTFLYIINSSFCRLYNINIKNYGNPEGGDYDVFWGICIQASANACVDINNIRFDNIKVVAPIITDPDDFYGEGKCIEIRYVSSLGTGETFPTKISNIICKNCYTITNSGVPTIDDFDCIHVTANEPNYRYTEVYIENCYFENVNKRAIKAQALNVNINNIVYRNPGNIPLDAVIAPYGERCVVKNVRAFPTTSCWIVINSNGEVALNDISVICPEPVGSGNNYTWLDIRAFCGKYSEIKNCNVINAGTALYFYPIGRDTTRYFGETYDYSPLKDTLVENCQFDGCYKLTDKNRPETITCMFSSCIVNNCGYANFDRISFVNSKITYDNNRKGSYGYFLHPLYIDEYDNNLSAQFINTYIKPYGHFIQIPSNEQTNIKILIQNSCIDGDISTGVALINNNGYLSSVTYNVEVRDSNIARPLDLNEIKGKLVIIDSDVNLKGDTNNGLETYIKDTHIVNIVGSLNAPIFGINQITV